MNSETERRIQEGRRKGGMTKSPARAEASRANGAKGGRPRSATIDPGTVSGVFYTQIKQTPSLSSQDRESILAGYRKSKGGTR